MRINDFFNLINLVNKSSNCYLLYLVFINALIYVLHRDIIFGELTIGFYLIYGAYT